MSVRACQTAALHLVKLRGKLQHAPALSHAQIARKNKEKRCVLELELAAPMPVFERAQRCAVFTRVLAPPEGVAALVGRPERAVRLQIQNMVRIGIDQPHHGEQLPQVMHRGDGLTQRRVAARRRLQHARLHRVVNIGELTDRAGIVEVAGGPDGAGVEDMPAVIAVYRDEHLHLHIGVLARGIGEQLPQPRKILMTEQRNAVLLALVQIHYAAALFGRRVPVGVDDLAQPAVVFKLDAAALRGKKFALRVVDGEQARTAVVARELLLLKRLAGKPPRFQAEVKVRGVLPGGGPERIRHGAEAVEQRRVERAALPGADHVHRHLVREGFFVAALVRERVVHIRQRHDLRRDGDLAAAQPVGVATPVPALVMPAADLARGLEQGVVLRQRHAAQQLVADDAVALHLLKFLRRELAGLVENFLRHGDLADVVQRRERGDAGDVRLGERAAAACFREPSQQPLGERAHMQQMRPGFAAA